MMLYCIVEYFGFEERGVSDELESCGDGCIWCSWGISTSFYTRRNAIRVLCRLKRNFIYILILLSLLVVVTRHSNSRTGRSPQKLNCHLPYCCCLKTVNWNLYYSIESGNYLVVRRILRRTLRNAGSLSRNKHLPPAVLLRGRMAANVRTFLYRHHFADHQLNMDKFDGRAKGSPVTTSSSLKNPILLARFHVVALDLNDIQLSTSPSCS